MKNNWANLLILSGLAYMYLMFGNGIVSLTNPDEVFYAQTAKEMMQNKTWMTPYLFGEPQFEKPIFLYWFMRASFSIFGLTSFAARFSCAFFGILGVIAVYFLALIGFKDRNKAFISGLALLSSGFYIGLSRSVFTDLIFSVLILFALLAFYWGYAYSKRKGWGIVLFFASSGLAVLAKGPLGVIIPLTVVAVFLMLKRDLKFLFCRHALWGLLIFAVIALPWYILMEIKYGASFNREFFYNDHFVRLIKAEHLENDRWYFYPFTMLGTVFPWSLYTLIGLAYLFKNIRRHTNDFNLFLAVWVSAVLLIFQFAHSKLTSYIFPLYPALIIIAGDFIYNSISGRNKGRLFYFSSLAMSAFILIVAVGITASLPAYSAYISSRLPVYALSVALLILGGSALFFVLRKKFLSFILVLASSLFVVLFGTAALHKDIEIFVSSKAACEYLLKNYAPSAPIICSKFYLRGVKYYTDKEVVVVDIPGTPFFSPHPVPFLNSHPKVREFLAKHPVNYGILKRANVQDFRYLTEGFYNFEVLKQIGNEYVVRVTPLTKE